jgi:hypothetical protein
MTRAKVGKSELQLHGKAANAAAARTDASGRSDRGTAMRCQAGRLTQTRMQAAAVLHYDAGHITHLRQ